MSKPTAYAGETDSKRLARVAIYQRVLDLQPVGSRPSDAVVLSGPDAGEVGCLRDLLLWQPEKAWFVENDPKHKKGLERVRREWPKAGTYFGDVKDVIRGLNYISFLHLDHMGVLDEERLDTVRLAASRIAAWGMVFYAFQRGRERRGVGLWTEILKAKATTKTLAGQRFVGGAQLLKKALGNEFVPVFSMSYTGVSRREFRNTRIGNMGVLGFQKVPSHLTSEFLDDLLERPTPFSGQIPTDKKLLQELLRTEALSIRRRYNLNSKSVASILNVSSGTVAAWFAMQSRGAY